MSEVDAMVAWAAGVYETTGTAARSDGRAMLNLKASTDGEVPELLVRFHAAIGGLGKLGGPYREQTPQKSDRRPFFMWYARGEDARLVIELLRPWLSPGRLEQWERFADAPGGPE